MKIGLLLMFLSAIGAAHAVSGDFQNVNPGFYTGNNYVRSADNVRAGYVTGFIDGLLASPLYGAKSPSLQKLILCMDQMTNDQVTAIVDKWLADNPAVWHLQMNALAFSAVTLACTGRP